MGADVNSRFVQKKYMYASNFSPSQLFGAVCVNRKISKYFSKYIRLQKKLAVSYEPSLGERRGTYVAKAPTEAIYPKIAL